MKQRTLYRENKCHVFQSVPWNCQHISDLYRPTTAGSLHLTPSPHVALLYLCFCSKFLAAFCLLSANFSSYPFTLVLYLWLFSVYCISDSFGFFLSSIISSHKIYNFLSSSSFYDLLNESVLIYYFQVLPFSWVWMASLASSNLSPISRDIFLSWAAAK